MMEEQPIGTKLTQLQATDSDSNIEAYHLSTNDYLEINNITGNSAQRERIALRNKHIHQLVECDWLRQTLFDCQLCDVVQRITSHLK